MKKKKSHGRQRQRSKPNGRATPHSAHRQQDKLTIRLPGLPKLTLSLGADERECYDSLKLPPKVQAFRALERRRDKAQSQIWDANREVWRLRQQLRETWLRQMESEQCLDFIRSYLAILATDQKTDFRFPIDDARYKKPKQKAKHYATTHCWWDGDDMGLSDFHAKRFYCSGACRMAADRRRDEISKGARSKSLAPDKLPCPYCETAIELNRLFDACINPGVRDRLRSMASEKFVDAKDEFTDAEVRDALKELGIWPRAS